MRILSLATAVALLSVPTTAVAAQAKDDRYDSDKMICKRVKTTGTRLGSQRVCMTRKQWNEVSSRTQEEHEQNMENSRRMNAPRG